MAARGPDFRTKFIDPLPASNADIGMTLAKLLALDLRPKGALAGRVLDEAFPGAPEKLPPVRTHRRVSEPTESGLRTVLKMQTVYGIHYLDAGGFPGRTLGLD
jgi:hypothetical protein